MWKRLLALVAVFALPMAACGDPEHGDSCQYHACSEDGLHAFFCQDGFFEKVPCPSGCTEFQVPGQLWVSCGLEGVMPGDACPTNANRMVLCEGPGRALVCAAGMWTRKACPERCESGRRGGGLDADGICE